MKHRTEMMWKTVKEIVDTARIAENINVANFSLRCKVVGFR